MGRRESEKLIHATRKGPSGSPSVLLDAGAVIALARADERLRARLRAASRDRARVIVPPIVVTQTLRGGPRDAPINQLLKTVDVPPVDLVLARLAGHLLGLTGLHDATDAQIAGEAARSAPCVVLTSDPGDMFRLLADYADVQIEDI